MTNFQDEISNLSSEEQKQLLQRLMTEKEQQPQKFPLSFSQERIWVLNRINPNIASYNIQLCISFKGVFEFSVLSRTVSEIVNRHEILRTTFHDDNGLPYQLIHESSEIEIEEMNLSAKSSATVDKMFRDICDEQLVETFNLEMFPLLRCKLIKCTDDFHYLLVTLHHIIFDGWSVNILVGDFVSIFGAFQNKLPHCLLPLEIQYADFCVWEKENPEFKNLAPELQFLYDSLSKGVEPLNLPMDYPRPAVQTLAGSMIQRTVPADITRKLHEIAKNNEATLFMILLGEFGLLLNCYTNQSRIRIGTPVAGRNQIETEKLIGCFINTVIIPLEIESGQTIISFLKDVRERAIKCYEYQEIPFEKILEKLQINLQNTQSLMQVMFQFIEYGKRDSDSASGVLKIGDIIIESVPLQPRTVNFDIAVAIEENEKSELVVSMHYSSEIFRQSTIEKLLNHFCQLLETTTKDLSKPISEISLLSEIERNTVLHNWQGKKASYPKVIPLPQLFEEQVAKTPHAIAVKFKDNTLTFAELNDRANCVAAFLIKSKVVTDKPIALITERSLEMVVCLLGVLKSGCAYLPIEINTPQHRINSILEDAGIEFLITSILEFKQTSNLGKINIFSIAEVEKCDELYVKPDIFPQNLAYVIYTSGSTGKPKGVMNTHQGIFNRLMWMQEEFVLTEHDRILQKTPIDFDVSVWEIFLPLITGAQLILALPEEHKNNNYLREIINRENITILHFVPPMLKVFLDSADGEDFQLSKLRAVVCSGEALPKHLQDDFLQKLKTRLYNLYGPTEAAVDVTFWLCENAKEQQTVPIGFPINNTQIYILNEYMNPVPIGFSGELYIGGENVSRGYLGNPSLTAEKFVPDPYSKSPGNRLYKTGDLVRYLADGSIDYIGRSDFQVKIRGNRIELGEIEIVLCSFDSISNALADVFTTNNGEKHLVAFVIRAEKPATAVELKNLLREKLPSYMIPDFIEFIDKFPLTQNGKTDRLQLRQMFVKERQSETPFVAPRTNLENELAKIWSELLGIEQIGVNDNFFNLGGHSLLLIQFASRVNLHLGVDVPLRMLFDNPMISNITAVITHLQIQNMKETENFAINQILDEIEGLSPEEIAEFLSEEEE
jgi:amino acid adenylation domain-containing protein